ncbi:MAG TPA: hypothetical protein DCQ33_11005 [Nitrospira sp.]|nr:hypothetical protein [Nitrospira sp.]
MSTSVFDPSVFLDAQINEANEKRLPLPTENPDDASGLYLAVIGEIKTDSGTVSKGDNAGKPWISMLIPLRIQVPSSVQGLGIPPELTLTDRAFLDLNAQGGLDNTKGKNRRQKDYRDATGTNVAGVPWSWRQLQGKTVKVKINHELYNDAIQERVGAVLAG